LIIFKIITAGEDSTVTISSRKAKELKVKEGDVVVLIGRRRNASYAHVAITDSSKESTKTKTDLCVISQNLASNLRLRQDDKVKIVPLKSVNHDESRSGDLLLLKTDEVRQATSISLAPVEDSLNALISSEGGDELSNDEILDRFVRPYFAGSDDEVQLLKQGHLISLRDESGRRLEFYVTLMEFDESATDDEKADGTYRNETFHILFLLL
jgi:hypothetical protein